MKILRLILDPVTQRLFKLKAKHASRFSSFVIPYQNTYILPKTFWSLLPHFIVSLISFHLFLAKYFLIIVVSTFVFLKKSK